MLPKTLSLDKYIQLSNRDNCGLFSHLSGLTKEYDTIIIDVWKNQKLGKKKTFVIIIRDNDLHEILHRTVYIDTEIQSKKHLFFLNVEKQNMSDFLKQFPVADSAGWGYGKDIAHQYNEYKNKVTIAEQEEINARGLDENEQCEFMLKAISRIYALNIINTDGNITRYQGTINNG